MNDIPDPRQDDADERRFTLCVWPQTQQRHWQAEVSSSGLAPPIRFHRPLDLVLFLTELSRSPHWHPRGLR